MSIMKFIVVKKRGQERSTIVNVDDISHIEDHRIYLRSMEHSKLADRLDRGLIMCEETAEDIFRMLV